MIYFDFRAKRMITLLQRAHGRRALLLPLALSLAACGSVADTEESAAPSMMRPGTGTSAPAAGSRSSAATATAATGTPPARAPGAAGKPAAASGNRPAVAGASAAGSGGIPGSAAAGSGGEDAAGSGGEAAAKSGGEAAAGSGGAGGQASAAAADRDPTIPCPVYLALANACHSCHGKVPTNGAPMSLINMADFQVVSVSKAKIPKYELARMRIDGSRRPLMPPDGWPITDEDKKTLLDWLSAATPAADGDNATCP